MKPFLKVVLVENAVILSWIIFSIVKIHMHMFNVLITSVQGFKVVAWNPWEELITQTCYPYWSPTSILLGRRTDRRTDRDKHNAPWLSSGGGGGIKIAPQNTTWPGCSKLTTSLVNVSLKFQTLISEIRQYFCWKTVLLSFYQQNIWL